MTEPVVRYVLSLQCDERLMALRGEVAVLAGDSTVWQGRLPPADLEGHISWAVMELARAGKDALDIIAATRPDESPPPTQPKRPTRRKPQPKDTGTRGVSISRRR